MNIQKLSKFVLPILLFFGVAFANDMLDGTEQYYVAQGIFADLQIQATECWQQDDTINFACGNYAGDSAVFRSQVDRYVGNALPGLRPLFDWGDSAGTMVRRYQSVAGSYLFALTDGFVVVAFTPR